jgi:nucleotide-binding universal stress UspA family protein
MTYTHILAATDFSAAGNQAVRTAFEEALLHGAKVTLLHVLHHQPDTKVFVRAGGDANATAILPTRFDPETGETLPLVLSLTPMAVWQDYNEEAMEKPRILVPAAYTGPREPVVSHDDPAHAIVQVAREHHVDLIVLGAHHHTIWHRLLQKRVLKKVMRQAPCAVLTSKDRTPLALTE